VVDLSFYDASIHDHKRSNRHAGPGSPASAATVATSICTLPCTVEGLVMGESVSPQVKKGIRSASLAKATDFVYSPSI
jgi:hypothetical protein